MTTLKFGKGNAKLAKEIITFSLPAGHSCPAAKECLAKVDRNTGKLMDGPEQKFRCFAASGESVFTTARNSRWANFDALKRARNRFGMFELINSSLPKTATIVRIHVSGDFYSAPYFLAWCDVARANPNVKFYAYTKSINIWISNLDEIPANLNLTASFGGRYDALIEEFELKSARVVFTIEEAMALGIDLDHDDTHAYNGSESFGLLLHGQQAKGSKASEALRALDGVGSYSRK